MTFGERYDPNHQYMVVMKTLSQHNREVEEQRKVVLKAGVLCDDCNTEMDITGWLPFGGGTKVTCPKCGKDGVKQRSFC